MPLAPYIPAIKYGNGLAGSEMDANTVSNSQIDTTLAQSATVSLSAANLTGMYSAPVAILPAPGAGKFIMVDNITFGMTPTTTSFTAGGVVSFFYHNTSVTAAGTMPAGYVTTGVAGVVNPYTVGTGSLAAAGTNQPFGALANLGIDISNATAAFATGTGTAKVYVNYQIITL